MARYAGKGGAAYISSTEAGTASPLLHVTSWSLNMPKDKIEVTAMDDENKTYVAGFKDVTGQLAAHWDDTDDSLFDAADLDGSVNVYLYPSKLVPGKYFYGPAWLDASISTSYNGSVDMTATITAEGSWGRK